MNRLIFKARNKEEAKKIVDFWNPYCEAFLNFAGTSEVYVIGYDALHCRRIIQEYQAMSEERSKSVTNVIRYFLELPVFMTFPKAVRDKMIENGSSHSPIPYILSHTASESSGGFDWDDSDEGWDFWHQVIEDRNFDLFYKQFNLSEHESRLCNEETPFGGGSDRNSSSIRSGFNKARVTIVSLSYKEVLGRG